MVYSSLMEKIAGAKRRSSENNHVSKSGGNNYQKSNNTGTQMTRRYEMPRDSAGAVVALSALSRYTAAKRDGKVGLDAFVAGSKEIIKYTENGHSVEMTYKLPTVHRGAHVVVTECGGRNGSYSGVNLAANENTYPMVPVSSYPANPNGKHSVFLLKEGCLIAQGAQDGDDALITIWKNTKIFTDTLEDNSDIRMGTFTLLYATESQNGDPFFVNPDELPDRFTDPIFQAFLETIWRKMSMERCVESLYLIPWSQWFAKGTPPREWEFPESTPGDILQLLGLGTGIGDPNPDTVVTDYNTMVDAINEQAHLLLQKYAGRGTGFGPEVVCLQYFTTESNGKVRITTYLLVTKVETPALGGTWVYYADPNAEQEQAYYLGSGWPIALNKHVTGTNNRVVSIYKGC